MSFNSQIEEAMLDFDRSIEELARKMKETNCKAVETVNLPVIRYRDTDGKPTCIADLSAGDACPFLQSSHFGTKYHCFLDKPNPAPPCPPQIFTRGDHGRGSLIPIDACPLWEGEER